MQPELNHSQLLRKSGKGGARKTRRRGREIGARMDGHSGCVLIPVHLYRRWRIDTLQQANLYQDRQQLLNALREQFQRGPDVEFHGCYEQTDTGVSHKQRIQTITHEIWRTTGYRFTCVASSYGRTWTLNVGLQREGPPQDQ